MAKGKQPAMAYLHVVIRVMQAATAGMVELAQWEQTDPAALLSALRVHGAHSGQHAVDRLGQVVQRLGAHGRALVGAALQQQAQADGAPGRRVSAGAGPIHCCDGRGCRVEACGGLS